MAENLLEQFYARLEALYAEYESVFKSFKLKSFILHPLSTIPRFFTTVYSVVLSVEGIATEYDHVPGHVKRDAAVEFLNKKIDIKLFGIDEETEEKVFGSFVDFVVFLINFTQGKEWSKEALKKAAELLGKFKEYFGG
jgi:hypothetical protein